jgi:hypothetical protein
VAREVRLWEWLRDGTIGAPQLHMCRVENGAGLGYPDVEACLRGTNFHLELKGCERKKDGRLGDDFHIRREQALWIRRRTICGGKAFLAVRVGSALRQQRYLIPGKDVLALQETPEPTEALLLSLSILKQNVGPLEFLEAAAFDWRF